MASHSSGSATPLGSCSIAARVKKPNTTSRTAGGHSTSAYLHHESWLDINTMQSGHGSGHDVPVWEWIARDYVRLPHKPTLDAEPNVAVDLSRLSGDSVRAAWFDRRTGAQTAIGEFATGGTHTFTTPAAHPETEPDWVLVIDRS